MQASKQADKQVLCFLLAILKRNLMKYYSKHRKGDFPSYPHTKEESIRQFKQFLQVFLAA
jgi:hypothetical protein